MVYSPVADISQEENNPQIESDADSYAVLFRTALVESLKLALIENKSVFLDGIGYLHSHKIRQRETYRDKQLVAFRNETLIVPEFEKALEPNSSLDKEVLSTHDLAHRILCKLPLKQTLFLTEKQIRKSFREFCRELRQELVSFGLSDRLQEIGTFFAHSNLSSGTMSELYTSADIYFEPKLKEVLDCSPATCFDSPQFFTAWEPLETAFQQSIKTWNLNMREQLAELGFEINASDELSHENIQVAAFAVTPDRAEKNVQIIYCTEGLRTPLKRNIGELYDQELTVQIEIEPHKANTEDLPQWPLKLLTLGWLLLQGYRNRSLKPGLVFSHNKSLSDEDKGKITSIITTSFNKLPGVFQIENSSIRFINITGITNEEANLTHDLFSFYMLQILKFKGLDQITKPKRSSFVRSK